MTLPWRKLSLLQSLLDYLLALLKLRSLALVGIELRSSIFSSTIELEESVADSYFCGFCHSFCSEGMEAMPKAPADSVVKGWSTREQDCIGRFLVKNRP